MPKCPYCGKEIEELSTLEIFINDESIGTAECCEDCAALLEKTTTDPNFEQVFHDFILELEKNWEPGNKDNTKVGSTIKVINLVDDPENHLYIGKTGVVDRIDDDGNIHGTWGGLSLIPGVDSWLILKSDQQQ